MASERCVDWRGCVDPEQPDLPCLNCGRPHREHLCPSAGERPATDETIPEAVIEAAAKAGQKLAVHWGHQPWSDSWAEQVARSTLEAALPHLSGYRGLLQERDELREALEKAEGALLGISSGHPNPQELARAALSGDET